METYEYCSQAIPLIAQTKQSSPEAAEALAFIRSIYDAEAPIHSKEAMRDVVQLLESDSSEIRVRAIDGQFVQFKRETGQTIDDDYDSDDDWIIGAPFVRFWPVQGVLRNGQNYPPSLSLCSMWIYHDLIERNRVTGEVLRLTPNQSSKDVAHFFELHRGAWEATEHCGRIRAILSDVIKSKITKIIAFACGSLTFNGQERWAVRSAYQHALLLTIKDVVNDAREGQASKVQCYVQDPIYCDCDREVLALYGIKTLENPEGFLEVDDSTAVLSFNPNTAVRQIVTDIACPAMMIWNRGRSNCSVSDVSEDFGSTDPNSPRLNRLLEDLYEKSIFPGDLDEFKGIAVYQRKTIFL